MRTSCRRVTLILLAVTACGGGDGPDPAIDAPDVDTPAIDAPAIDAPDVDTPAIDAPAIDAPAIDAPAIDAPAIDALAIDAPAIDAPAIDAPAIDASAIDASAIDAIGVDLGPLDPTFGDGGYRWLFPEHYEVLPRIAIQPDQRILVCGSWNGSGSVLRLQPDGSTDPTFGAGGLAPIAAFSDFCGDIAVLADGRIAVVSHLTDHVVLMSPSGTTVTSLPLPSAPPGEEFRESHLVPAPDGGFYLAIDTGYWQGFPINQLFYSSLVARYDGAGQLVATFGSAGAAFLTGPPYNGRTGAALVTTPDGVAHLAVATARNELVGLSAATGAPDGTFTRPSSAKWLAGSAAGHVIAAGAGGGDVQAISSTGTVLAGASSDVCPGVSGSAAGVALDPSQRPVVVRSTVNTAPVHVIRFRPDLGGLDPSGGCRTFIVPPPPCAPGPCSTPTRRTASDVAIAADGSILVVGQGNGAGSFQHSFIARLRPDP